MSAVPEQFFGTFKLERSEHFDEYLASKGVNWFVRKMIGLSSITKTVLRAEETGKYDFLNKSPKVDLAYRNVQLGTEFQGKGFDGLEHKVRFLALTDAPPPDHVRRGRRHADREARAAGQARGPGRAVPLHGGGRLPGAGECTLTRTLPRASPTGPWRPSASSNVFDGGVVDITMRRGDATNTCS